MSQVKNLRAMFENKGDDSSPPDRGRSPGPSGSTTPGASFAGSPRPLSRIRSSFVAIEKDGRMGLQRTTSDEGSLPRRKMSGDTDAESIPALSDNRSATAGDEATRVARRMIINDPIPESPRLPKDLEGSSHDIGAVTDEPSVNPDKQTDEEQPAKNLLPADPPSATSESTKPTTGVSAVNGKTKSAEEPSSLSGATKPTASTAAKKFSTRPSAISTRPAIKGPAASKSPAAVKTPTSASSSTATKSTAKATARTVSKRDATSTTTKPTASTATKSTASSAMKKPAPLKPSSSGTGFVKPKVKSPTKPVSLPPSLMAQTASSGAKGNVSRPSLTPQTGNAQARASSRTSGVTGASKFPKAPVSKHPRPSIGPPPKKIGQDRPVTRESNVDEGFLARMMRPTASSAQKTAEKVQLTPPKRTAGRPSTTSSRRESSVRSSSRAKTPSIHASESADDHKHHTSHIDEVAVETAIAETVEEAAEAAHEADLAPPAEELPVPAASTEVVATAATLVASQEAAEHRDADLPQSPAMTHDAVLDRAVVETAEDALELSEEAEQVQSPAKPEIDNPAHQPSPDDEISVEEVAVEAATVETADEVAALAEEADLVQAAIEPKTAKNEPKEDEAALELTNASTAEDASAIANEADSFQVPAASNEAADGHKAGEPSEEPEMPSQDIVESAVTEEKPTTPGSPIDSDIDSLADKLAETRIEAGDDKADDEGAKETR